MPTAIEAPPQSAAKMPAAEPLKLTPAGTDPGPSSAEPGSPLDRMMDRIAEKHAVETTLTPAKSRQAKSVEKPTGITTEPPKPDESKLKSVDKADDISKQAGDVDDADSAKPVQKEKGSDKSAEGAKEGLEDVSVASKDTKKEKVNPWKRGDEFKALYEKSEAEVLRLKKLLPDEADRTAKEEQFKKLETQNKELLERIRFIDYQNHPEFKEKYEQPYTDSWNRIMRRLSGVSIVDGETRRAVEPKDIAEIGRLPADQAIELAEQKFGKLGPWVAERVEELRQLDEAKYLALEKAKKDGVELHQRTQEAVTKQQAEMNEFLKSTWTKAIDEIKTHSKYGRFYNPVEGDDEYNAALDRGTSVVEKALGVNPLDPNLTQEQRAEAVKAQAALRNRAMAFSPMRLTIERLEAKLAEVTEKLKQFEASVPKTDGSEPPTTPTQQGNSWDALGQRLAGYAK